MTEAPTTTLLIKELKHLLDIVMYIDDRGPTNKGWQSDELLHSIYVIKEWLEWLEGLDGN